MWLMYPINSATTETEVISAMEQLMQNPMMVPAAILSLLLLIAHVLLLVKGNQLYLHHCTKKINKALQQTPDLSAVEIGSLGGVSIGVALALYFLSIVLVNGIGAYIMM